MGLTLAGVLASVSQLVEGWAANVECHPANNREEEGGYDANTVVTCTTGHLCPHGAGSMLGSALP